MATPTTVIITSEDECIACTLDECSTCSWIADSELFVSVRCYAINKISLIGSTLVILHWILVEDSTVVSVFQSTQLDVYRCRREQV